MFNPRTFPCPNCREIINDQMQVCRYCSVPVDPAIASQQAELQSKVNKACSDASFMRTVAAAMYVFLILSFMPFVPFVGWGFLFTFFLVLIMAVRWQLSFGGLVTGDTDYVKAKRSKNVALILWIVAIPLGFIVRPLVYLYIMQLFNR